MVDTIKEKTPRERFEALGEKRLHNAMVCLKRVRQLANRRYYEFTEDEKNTIIKELNTAINGIKNDFKDDQLGKKQKTNERPKYFK